MGIDGITKLSFFEITLFLYLAIAPIAWFASSPIGIYKRILLVLLLIFSITKIKVILNKDFLLVLIAYSCLFTSVWINGLDNDLFNFSSGYIENILFFIIGCSIASKDTIINKIAPWTYYILALFCLLTITNFAIGIPAWTSPSMEMISKSDPTSNFCIQSVTKVYSFWPFEILARMNSWTVYAI